MIYSQTGLHLTEQFESCRLTAYRDSGGIWTIGYGHTMGVKQGDTCTQDQAIAWLGADVESAARAVNDLVTIELEQDEFDAVTDLVFNIGVHAFKNSTMLRMLNAGDIAGAAGQFERWDMCGGKHLAGLLRRRIAEEILFKGPPK